MHLLCVPVSLLKHLVTGSMGESRKYNTLRKTYTQVLKQHGSQEPEIMQIIISQGTDKENVVYPQNRLYLREKKNRQLIYATIWMHLKVIFLGA